MPDEYERLRRRIEDGLKAADELERRLASAERTDRKRNFRLIKGGLLGGAIWAGVEWFRDYKRAAVALTATGMAVSGAVLVEQPDWPGADPPRQVIVPPPKAEPATKPTARPTGRPTPSRPPRTSPLRTTPPMRIAPPVELTQPTPSRVAPTPRATKTPVPVESATVVPPVTVAPTIPPTSPCIIDLLGIKLCLPHG